VKPLPKPINFNWDKGNLEKNQKRHQVSCKECEEIFFNKPLKILEDIKHSQKEDRFYAFGITDRGRKLSVAFTIRKQNVRIISARNQNKRERQYNEKQN
jgi:uncharacterized protein